MKVLHVIDALGLGGGAEHSLAQLLPHLRRAGVASVVACLVRRQGGLQAHLRDQGFDVRILDRATFLGRLRALRGLLESESIDLIHATLLQSCLVSRIAAIGCPIPQINSLVNTSYDQARTGSLGVAAWKLQVIRFVDRITARFLVDRFHAVTEVVKQTAVQDLHISPDLVTVVPRGRSLETLGTPTVERRRDVRRSLGLEMEQPVLLNVGRQDHQKGQVHLVEALPAILRHYPNTQVLIAGREGSASSEIQEAIRKEGVESSIRLLGHREDVGDLLTAADVFVFPSLYEGIGGAALEAMALKVPIVAYDIPVMREVVGQDVAGRLVSRESSVALARTIHELLSNPARRLELGECGQRRFLERYTLGAVTKKTLAMYRSTLVPTTSTHEGLKG